MEIFTNLIIFILKSIVNFYVNHFDIAILVHILLSLFVGYFFTTFKQKFIVGTLFSMFFTPILGFLLGLICYTVYSLKFGNKQIYIPYRIKGIGMVVVGICGMFIAGFMQKEASVKNIMQAYLLNLKFLPFVGFYFFGGIYLIIYGDKIDDKMKTNGSIQELLVSFGIVLMFALFIYCQMNISE